MIDLPKSKPLTFEIYGASFSQSGYLPVTQPVVSNTEGNYLLMYSVFKIVYCIAALYICMYSMSQKNYPFNFPGFIEKKQWPPNCRDLNPLGITSGVPSWKSTINCSQSPRQLMSWKSLCRPSANSCHKTISVVNFTKCLTACVAASCGHFEHLQ